MQLSIHQGKLRDVVVEIWLLHFQFFAKAQARVDLLFGSSQKLKRDRPVLASVTEEMVRENGEWKIKVW